MPGTVVNQRSLFAHWLTSDQPLVNQSAESGGVWRSLADPRSFPKNATPLYISRSPNPVVYTEVFYFRVPPTW